MRERGRQGGVGGGGLGGGRREGEGTREEVRWVDGLGRQELPIFLHIDLRGPAKNKYQGEVLQLSEY